MKNYVSIGAILLLWIASIGTAKAQKIYFQHTLSGAAYSHPALMAFRETPIVGLQYNNNRGAWKNSFVSASVPLKNFGVHGGWLRDASTGLNGNLLTLGLNKKFQIRDFKVAVALGLDGSRRSFNPNTTIYFPDELHERFEFSPIESFEPRHKLMYAASAAMEYKGLMLFASTRYRELVSSGSDGTVPFSSLGMGYRFQKGNWQAQALGSYSTDGSFSTKNGIIGARYRFVELGFGGQKASGPKVYPRVHLALVAKRFKVSYGYLNRTSAISLNSTELNWREHEISLLVALHKKGGESNLPLF